MSAHGGTRHKKISVAHMLGEWEGKIEGCNCPACKEIESGCRSHIRYKIKHPQKQNSVNPVSSTKSVSAVKTGVHTLTKESSEIGEASSNESDSDYEEVSLNEALEHGDVSSYKECKVKNSVNNEKTKELDVISSSCSIKLKSGTISSVDISNRELRQSVHDKRKRGVSSSSEYDADGTSVDDFSEKSDDESHKNKETVLVSSVKVTAEARSSRRMRRPVQLSKNVYDKPRLIFTGTGFFHTIEPTVDETPKSNRGRKPKKAKESIVGNEKQNTSVKEEVMETSFTEESCVDYYMVASDDTESIIQEDDVNESKLFQGIDENGEKYAECAVCFKVLKETSIKQHYKTHTGERPHQCNQCKARFTRKGDVTRHKKLVHQHKKPFKCDKCPKGFSDEAKCSDHLRNHDKTVYYACETCGFKFGKREYYDNHVRYIHPLPGRTVAGFHESGEGNGVKHGFEVKNVAPSVPSEMQKWRILPKVIPSNDLGERNQNQEDSFSFVDESAVKQEYDAPTEEMLDVNLDGSTAEEGFTDKASTNGTEIELNKSTLSLTHTVSNGGGCKDEDLVHKAIDAAVSQSADTLESLQSFTETNFIGDSNVDDGSLDGEDETGKLEVKIPPDNNSASEIRINASIGGQLRRFIIQIPSGSNISAQTEEGMELIVNMVNQLCAGRGELDGPLEIVMQQNSSGK